MTDQPFPHSLSPHPGAPLIRVCCSWTEQLTARAVTRKSLAREKEGRLCTKAFTGGLGICWVEETSCLVLRSISTHFPSSPLAREIPVPCGSADPVQGTRPRGVPRQPQGSAVPRNPAAATRDPGAGGASPACATTPPATQILLHLWHQGLWAQPV